MTTNPKVKQPIVTIVGHVDHGKTSILDSLRGTAVQESESGGITQKISFTSFPAENLKSACPLIEKKSIKLEIPGFLFIDTPGHAAFTNLRKRGGSLANLAVLVVDINEGIKPQTSEVIQILKHNKTPFVIALNKIDNISGWTFDKNSGVELKQSVETQPINAKRQFEEKLFTLMGAFHAYGLESDLFYHIEDFTKKIALVPCSAKTKQGLQELVLMLCGLSQKYLVNKLTLSKETKGVILEVKKSKSVSYAEAILYDGILEKTDEIAIANFVNPEKPIITKIRILEEVEPLNAKFKAKQKAQASTGLRLQLKETTDILPGMPFLIYKNNEEKIKEEFKKTFSEAIKLDKEGIIAKADSLGSLEALLTLLKQSKVPVVKAGIGSINKSDVISAKANLDINELDSIVVGFNVQIDEDAKSLSKKNNIKILTDGVIYKLIENLADYRVNRKKEIEKTKLMQLAALCKLEILHQYVFHNSNPAVFGVKVSGGKITSNLPLIDISDSKVGRIKNIQSQNKSVEQVTEDMEVAISIPGSNYERKIKHLKSLYSDVSESQFKKFKKNKELLTDKEKKILQEISEIKRKKKENWGE